MDKMWSPKFDGNIFLLAEYNNSLTMASRFLDHHFQQWEELQSMSPTFLQSWEDYLLSIELDTDRVTNIITDLSECTCCEAHQQNRPDYLCKPVNEPPEEKENFLTKCNCPCRHNIRNLCRIFSS